MLSIASVITTKAGKQYLGHVILSEGIAVDPEKIKTIMECATQIMLLILDHSWAYLVTTVDSLKSSWKLPFP